MKRCKWNDIEYPSITAAAKANNITMQAMSKRILNHQTCDDDMWRNTPGGISCEWEGIAYDSIQKAAMATGIPYHNLLRWIQRGFTKPSDIKRGKYTRYSDINLELFNV